MDNSELAIGYEPLISGADRIIRAPLAAWQQQLLRMLRDALQAGAPDWERVAVALNQLALLEAYQGHAGNARHLCDCQIALWREQAAHSGEQRYLSYVLQPWINVIRLARWQDAADGQGSLYEDLAPWQRDCEGALQQRYGIGASLAQLCALGDGGSLVELLDHVYWREYGRLLLKAGALPQLQALLGKGLNRLQRPFIRLVLMELLLLQQVRSGNAGHAAALLARMELAPDHRLWLHFKVMENYLAAHTGQGGSAGPDPLLRAALERGAGMPVNGYGVNLAWDIARVWRALGWREAELELLQRTAGMARQAGDEAVEFEAEARTAQVAGLDTAQVRERFAASSYALIRSRIGLARTAGDDPLSLQVGAAAACLAARDIQGCAHLLDGIVMAGHAHAA